MVKKQKPNSNKETSLQRAKGRPLWPQGNPLPREGVLDGTVSLCQCGGQKCREGDKPLGGGNSTLQSRIPHQTLRRFLQPSPNILVLRSEAAPGKGQVQPDCVRQWSWLCCGDKPLLLLSGLEQQYVFPAHASCSLCVGGGSLLTVVT